MNKIKFGMIIFAIGLLIGCDLKPANNVPPPAPVATAEKRIEVKEVKPIVEESNAAKTVDPIIQVTVVDAESFAAALKKHEGKVVLIDFWATYCAPCLKRFPETVELFRKYADQGVVVISFSVDDLEDLELAKEFLAKQKHEFAFKGEHYISKFGVSTETEKAFDVAAVPDFRLYDREGKLHKRWKEDEIVELKEEAIIEEIDKLLAEKK